MKTAKIVVGWGLRPTWRPAGGSLPDPRLWSPLTLPNSGCAADFYIENKFKFCELTYLLTAFKVGNSGSRQKNLAPPLLKNAPLSSVSGNGPENLNISSL